MKATVVCGLLGSGKTTFLVEALRQTKERAVVLVNDFGQMGIDGEILSVEGVPTIELPSGCVCCTLRPDLLNTLSRVIEGTRPDHILIEPSGVASPSGVLDALNDSGIMRISVVGILDATEFLDMEESGMYGRFLLDQVTQADVLLVNKADLAGEPLTSRTVSRASALNPGAVVLPTVMAQLAPSVKLPFGTRVSPLDSPLDLPHFESFAVRLPAGAGLDQVVACFEQMIGGAYGDIVRAKALVQGPSKGFRVDLASGRVQHSGLDRFIDAGRVVVIGRNLDTDGLSRAFSP